MIAYLTKAKPYAKAIFNLALECNQVTEWQSILNTLAKIVIECEKNKLLNNPKITLAEKVDFFTGVIKQYPEAIINLVKLLIERKKITLLSDIVANYQQLFYAHNKIIEVKIISAQELALDQKEKFLCALKQHYQKEILLRYYIDASLIGGAVVCVADKVIDGSAKGMLQHLKKNLCLE